MSPRSHSPVRRSRRPPVRLSIVVALTGWQGAGPLPCFPAMAPSTRRLPFLLRGPGEPSSPALSGTTKALRLPIRVSMVAYLVRFHCPRVTSAFVLRRSALGSLEDVFRARALARPAALTAGFELRGREWDLSGLQTIHPVPLLRSSTPVEPMYPRHGGYIDAAPATHTAKASAMADFGADSRSFGTC
jgi:hypothetical protein